MSGLQRVWSTVTPSRTRRNIFTPIGAIVGAAIGVALLSGDNSPGAFADILLIAALGGRVGLMIAAWPLRPDRAALVRLPVDERLDIAKAVRTASLEEISEDQALLAARRSVAVAYDEPLNGILIALFAFAFGYRFSFGLTTLNHVIAPILVAVGILTIVLGLVNSYRARRFLRVYVGPSSD